MNKKKLCFVLPEYNKNTPTHFNYLYDFIRAVSGDFDIFLIIEKGGKPNFDLGCRRVQAVWFKFFLLRAAEVKLRIFYARLSGYKDFYVHYSFLAAFMASWIVKVFGGRVFYWNCGLPWNYKRGFLRERFERLVYKMISFLVTGTESLKKEYAKNYHLPPEKIKVMPNWIDVEKVRERQVMYDRNKLLKQLKINSGEKIILFAHRLSRRKGAHYLPEILKKLEKENIILIVVGDGPERGDIESRIKNYELSEKARFLGWRPQNEVLEYFTIADLFIMPSEEEGFPHVLLEAMASGTPFVAFDVGGVKEITPPEIHSFVVSPGNIISFVDRIKELLRGGSNYLKLGVIEKNWVNRFDIVKVTEQFKILLK
ncbi:MAG: Glycosyl transferase, group 1 [Parcubacteria group bacterium Athens0714_26]|nr:MAG: Glycosyl transferase, group 1 [Parcubacteria group bacterium Athens0714_26]